MTYRANGSYLKLKVAAKPATTLNIASKSRNTQLAENKSKTYLRDEPAIKANQNVYDSLSE